MLAAGLLSRAGLPQRADYTGQTIPGLGRVAPEVGAIAPPFDALTLAGERVSLLDLRGNPVIINFWATWCEPCRVEMPELQGLYERREDVTVLAVNLGEPLAVIQPWVEALDLSYPLVLDPAGEITAAYRVRVQPTTYLIGAEGRIQHISYGPTTADALSQALTPTSSR